MAGWMIVTSPLNFARSLELKFARQGVKSRHRRKAERMQPGDRLAFYITAEAVFAAVCEVTSTVFEDHTRIWTAPGKPAENYPWRIRMRPTVVVPEGARVPAASLRERLTFVRKWPPAHWRLAFQGNVHPLPDVDMNVIEAALRSRVAVT